MALAGVSEAPALRPQIVSTTARTPAWDALGVKAAQRRVVGLTRFGSRTSDDPSFDAPW